MSVNTSTVSEPPVTVLRYLDVVLLAVAAPIMLLIGGRMVLRHELTIGELTAFVLYINAFFQPVQQLVQLYTQYQQARAAMGKITGLAPPEVTLPEQVAAIRRCGSGSRRRRRRSARHWPPGWRRSRESR